MTGIIVLAWTVGITASLIIAVLGIIFICDMVAAAFKRYDW